MRFSKSQIIICIIVAFIAGKYLNINSVDVKYIILMIVIASVILLILFNSAFEDIKNYIIRLFNYSKFNIKENNDLKYHNIENKESLEKLFFESDNKKLGEIYLVSSQEKPYGAFIKLNNSILKKNRYLIKKEFIKRNSNNRMKADVFGFNRINNNPININGKKYYNYQRTHLIPFRFCLSEGETIHNLLFTGTSHLNAGIRPAFGYIIDFNGEFKEPIGLKTLDKRINKAYNIKKKYTIKNICAFEHPKDEIQKTTNISLNDLELFVDTYIRKKENIFSEFSYGVFCEYDENFNEIPKGVSVYFINETKNKLIFGIYLPNNL